MTKVKNSILILLILAVICAISAVLLLFGHNETVYASSSEDVRYAYNNGEINITVDENKVLHVEENLTVAFLKETKYFNRALPGKMRSYLNVNGTALKGRSFLARISNLSAEIDGESADVEMSERNGLNQYFTVINGGGNFIQWVNGSDEGFYNIRISYLLDLSEDIDGRSTFYYKPFINYYSTWIFFDGDRNNVSKLTVTVNLPAAFKERDAVMLNDGKKTDGLKFNSEKSLTAAVPFKNAGNYTLRVMLPENTFKTSRHYYSFYWWFVGAVAGIMLFGAVLAFIYRARRPLCPVEYTPPIINPMHFSAFWHGYARKRDICTVILRWAQLGCITVKKDGKKDLIVTKIKELPEGRPAAEYRYFKALFTDCGVYSSRKFRSKEYRAYRKEIRYAATELIKQFGEPVTHAKGVETAKITVMFSSLMTLVISFAYFIFLAGDIASSLVLFFVVGALAIVVGKTHEIVLTGRQSKIINKNNVYKITSLIVSVCLFPVALIIYFIAASHYMPVYDYIHITLISAVWIIVCLYILPKFIAKRTDEAQKMYGRMLGFKKFLSLAKVSEMELMLEKNPDYYADVLPYCMIMGLSKKLDKKTEFLAAPEWADGFAGKHFASSMFYSVRHAVITRKKKVKK